jgi:NDP-sugar pyrophosphorylase family protein
MKELGKEFVPYLISRQFRGLKASFGANAGTNKKNDETIEAVVQTLKELKLNTDNGRGIGQFEDEFKDAEFSVDSDHPFLVSANVLARNSSKLMLRACTIPAYTYACREVVSQAIATSKVRVEKEKKEKNRESDVLYLPSGASVNEKFNSVTLPGAEIGEKVQVKSSTIGRGVKIGNRCRLNNVVVHDNVIIGENCVLQNSIFSEGSKVGDNCNLNDCQVGSKSDVLAGTKAKGEGF